MASLSVHGAGLTPFQDPKKGLFGLKDEQGKVVLKAEYEAITEETSVGGYLIKSQKGYGIADNTGKVLLKAEYDTIAAEPSISRYFVKKKGKYGMTDQAGKTVVKTEYRDMLSIMSDGKVQTIYFLNSDYAKLYPNIYIESNGRSGQLSGSLNIKKTGSPKWLILNDRIYKLVGSESFRAYEQALSKQVTYFYFNEKSGNGWVVVSSSGANQGNLYICSNGQLLDKWNILDKPFISEEHGLSGVHTGEYNTKGKIDKFFFWNHTPLLYLKDYDEWCVSYLPYYSNRYICDLTGKVFGEVKEDETVIWLSDQDRVATDGVKYKYADGQWSAINPVDDSVLFSVNGEKDKNPLRRMRGNSDDGTTPNLTYFTYADNGKIGLYKRRDNTYERILEVQYDSIEINHLFNEVYAYNNGKVGVYYPDPNRWGIKGGVYDSARRIAGTLFYWVSINGKYGVADNNGKEIIPPKYDEMWLGSKDRYSTPNHYSFYIKDKNGQIGVLNDNAKLVVPFGRYDKIIGIQKGVIIGKKGNKVGATNYTTGFQIASPIYSKFEGTGGNGNLLFSLNQDEVATISPKGTQVAKLSSSMFRYQIRDLARKYLGGSLTDFQPDPE